MVEERVDLVHVYLLPLLYYVFLDEVLLPGKLLPLLHLFRLLAQTKQVANAAYKPLYHTASLPRLAVLVDNDAASNALEVSVLHIHKQIGLELACVVQSIVLVAHGNLDLQQDVELVVVHQDALFYMVEDREDQLVEELPLELKELGEEHGCYFGFVVW